MDVVRTFYRWLTDADLPQAYEWKLTLIETKSGNLPVAWEPFEPLADWSVMLDLTPQSLVEGASQVRVWPEQTAAELAKWGL
jgi:hypothetical protein